ncbi:MAG: phytanoyl-CoA dioxygenase family protein [Planctomycetes bacterium]|nr:phytanoyl-CoA dioxygenase family protein [Planctomycetota bacterium]
MDALLIDPQTPDTAAASPAREFSAEDVDTFRRDGYVIARKLAGEALRERLLAATFAGLADPTGPVEYEADLQYPGAPPSRSAPGGRTIRRLKQAHARDFGFTEWVAQPELVARVRQLLGPDIVCPLAHHNCVMTKQPRFSSETGWHQDIRYWSYQRPELVSVWLALGPERIDNGCLWVIPGTHRMQFDAARFDPEKFLRPDLTENAELIAQRRPVELEAGDVLFFHCRTFHAAGRNESDEPKFSVVFTFRPADNPPVPGTRSASLPELLIP